MLVIFQRNYKLAVGKVITVRPHDKAHQWFEVRITELGEHGYFLADRA